MSKKISELDENTKNKIHSEQIIKSVVSAIKELLDNSIDAEASTISISLLDFGLKKIETFDNGSGMSSEDLLKVGKRGATSKMHEKEENLARISFLGFRVLLKRRRTLRFIQTQSRLLDPIQTYSRNFRVCVQNRFKIGWFI